MPPSAPLWAQLCRWPARPFRAPTQEYKTGVVFLARLNGFQNNFIMLNGAQLLDIAQDHAAFARNTATLGHNLDGHGAGWPVERMIDACAVRGLGGTVFWQRQIGAGAIAIGNRTRAAGLQVGGLCRTPSFRTGCWDRG